MWCSAQYQLPLLYSTWHGPEDKGGHLYEPCQAGRLGLCIACSWVTATTAFMPPRPADLVTRPEKGKTLWRVRSLKDLLLRPDQ